MFWDHLSEPARAILLDALVSYSDACTMPRLTPSCPFYVAGETGPTCEEQCRDLIAESGAADRGIREVRVGGLVLRGRYMPRSVATGVEDYDATQKYLSERLNPPADQSTGSLLLGLNAAMDGFPGPSDRPLDDVMPLWGELERRGVPVERVVRAAVLPAISSRIGLLAALPAIREAGVWSDEVSDDFLDELQRLADSGWSQLLIAAIEAEGNPDAARRVAVATTNNEVLATRFGGRASLLGEVGPSESGLSPEIAQWLVDDVRAPYGMSLQFSNRVLEWLCRLLNENLFALLEWQAPPRSVFLALPTVQAPIDEVGLWIWERFTETRLQDWSASSLVQEWQSGVEGSAPISQLVWAERRTDPSEVASLALAKFSHLRKQAVPQRGLEAIHFVNAAMDHLHAGETQKAADIFAGLVGLRPADGDALNNLGFCLLPLDPRRALDALQKASLYPKSNPIMSNANRVLALHLLERDKDAIQLAEEALANAPAESHPAYTWRHDHSSSELVLTEAVDPRAYLVGLLEHLRRDGDVR